LQAAVEGCGNAGPVERVEKQKQLSHSFHRPLEISQTARDFHIPTARLRATMTLISLSKHKNQRKEAGRYAASPLNFHDHLVLETEPDFMIILRLENAH